MLLELDRYRAIDPLNLAFKVTKCIMRTSPGNMCARFTVYKFELDLAARTIDDILQMSRTKLNISLIFAPWAWNCDERSVEEVHESRSPRGDPAWSAALHERITVLAERDRP